MQKIKVSTKIVQHVLFAILFIAFVILFFHISLNTILANRTIPFLKVENKTTFFLSNESIDSILEEHIQNLQNAQYTLVIDGVEHKIEGTSLGISADSNSVIKYGKGSMQNLFSAYSKQFRGQNLSIGINIETENITNKFWFESAFDSTLQLNADICSSKVLPVELDIDLLAKVVAWEISNSNNTIFIDSTDFAKSTADIAKIQTCEMYLQGSQAISKFGTEIGSNNLQNAFDFDFQNSSPTWEIANSQILRDAISTYNSTIQIEPSDGYFENIDGKIYLYEQYRVGIQIDIDTTVNSISEWIKMSSTESAIVYKYTNPWYIVEGLEVLDFTNVMGYGETRMHTVYDNTIGQAEHAITGLDEIHNYVVAPGEEFSYFGAIGANGEINQWTKNNRLIAIGICTSVTTLFRATLDAGLPTVFRENHGEYVYKYMWNPNNFDPKGLDLVDATFLALPDSIIDFKFRNDYNSPLLIRRYIWYTSDGFQQHKIEIRTSAKQPVRDVFIGNFRISDYVSRVKFNSYFDRVVKENGIELINETYTSDYQWGTLYF